MGSESESVPGMGSNDQWRREMIMRLFVGLEPTSDFRAALSTLQTLLRTAGVEGRYLLPSNLHMTLAFIGEWPEAVTEALPVITKPFSITLSSLGIFPEAKVLWAGVRPSPDLQHLSENVRKQLAASGIPYDRRDFCPHITLIRKPLLPGAETLASVQVPPAAMTVREVCLYQSVHEADGMRYSVIGQSMRRSSPSAAPHGSTAHSVSPF